MAIKKTPPEQDEKDPKAAKVKPKPTSAPPVKTAGFTHLGPIKLKILRSQHPTFDLAKIKRLQALYRGGSALLENASVMATVFPKYVHEKDGVYGERKKRAFYENLFAQVINMISAGLAQDPVAFDGEKPTDLFWEEIMAEATPLSDDGSTSRSFDQVCRDVVTEGLVTGWGWAQTDLPREAEAGEELESRDVVIDVPGSLKDQEESGGLRSYLIPWPTDYVTDWEEKNGKLLWLRTYDCSKYVEDPTQPRESTFHCWTVWTPEGWTKYEIEQKKDKELPPEDNEITPTSWGAHSFGRVPWVRFLTSNTSGAHLHVGDLIDSLCRNYFNRQNGEAFQWTQYNYQQLYEFLGPEMMGIDTVISEAQTDTARAKRVRAPGEVHVRGAEDRAEYVGPDMGGAEVGRNALQDLRDGILRVTAQMALAQDTSGAMLRRSGDSKRQDSLAQEIVLGVVGKRALVMARRLAELLAIGRGDGIDTVPQLRGYERFSVMDLEALTAQDLSIEAIDIPSATFQIERKFQLAMTRLGDSIDEETRTQIREELEGAITQDQLEGPEPGFDEDGNPLAEVDADGNPVKPEEAEGGLPFGKEKEEKPGAPFGAKAKAGAKKADDKKKPSNSKWYTSRKKKPPGKK